MAGILANSASVTMSVGTPDNTQAGYVENEAVTLSTNPAGTTHEWGLAKPQGSTALGDLSATTGTGIQFIPDEHGTWTITCTVDNTTAYTLRISVTAVAITHHANGSRYMPVTNNSIPTPATGVTVFYSSDDDRLSYKDTTGTVYALTGTVALGTTRITDADSPYTILPADTVLYCDTDGGAITANLPAGTDGKSNRVINTGSSGNDVTLAPDGAELLNGINGSELLADGESLDIRYETTEGWW